MALLVLVQVILGAVYGLAALIAAYFAGEAAGDAGGYAAVAAVVLLAPLASAAAFSNGRFRSRGLALWAVGVAATVAALLYAVYGYDS